MENTATAVAKQGWFASVKSKLNVDGITQKLNLSRSRLIELGLYLGIGFLAGFLFKKYAKYLLVVVLMVVALAVLHQFKFIDVAINWNKIQGLQPTSAPVDSNMLTVYWEWVKANFAVVLSFSVGFFVGFKVG